MSSIIIPKHESFPKKNYSKANDSHPISSINTNISEVAKNKQENITRFSPSLNNTECNDLTMRKVIMQNIHSNPSTAKRQIQLAMRKKFVLRSSTTQHYVFSVSSSFSISLNMPLSLSLSLSPSLSLPLSLSPYLPF
uniref:Bm14692 n=1 Tax=Brugia malayi TaxID=6279 RepID=A0A0J9XRW1_BRUMA|nr:Bm14692 [Brugia malayi]